MLAMGAIAVSSYLPMFIAQGQTRGRFVLANTLSLAALAVLLAIFIAVGYLVEGLIVGQPDWSQMLTGDHLFTSPAQVHLVILQYFAHIMLYGIVGLLVGYGFYRAGGWWGTALLLVTAVLPLVIGYFLINQDIGFLREEVADNLYVWLGLSSAAFGGIALALLFEALLVAVLYLLMRRVPIRPKGA